MKRALSVHLVPALRELGFAGDGEMHRYGDDWHDVLAIQYHKYGGSFILEISRIPRGPLEVGWSDPVPEDEVTVAHTPLSSRARLVDHDGEDLFHGFSFAAFGEDAAAYDGLAIKVAGLLPQAQAWLASRSGGPNIETF